MLLHYTYLVPVMCQQLESRLTCLSFILRLSLSLCPLGVPLNEAPGCVDQGSLPASQSVGTLGRDDPAPRIVLAFRLHLSQRVPCCCAAVPCATTQGFTVNYFLKPQWETLVFRWRLQSPPCVGLHADHSFPKLFSPHFMLYTGKLEQFIW